MPPDPKRSRRPSIFSMAPLVASLSPARLLISLYPRLNHLPVTAPGATPPPSLARRLARHAIPLAAAAAVVGGSFAVAHRTGTGEKTKRGTAAPTLKMSDAGSPIRWHADAVDVVLDDSFTELAGSPKLYSAAVDAWRATGAILPSVSTRTAKDRKVGYEQHGTNENVVVFAPFGWAKAHGALAVTIITYDDVGRIVDADVLINGGGRFFSVFPGDKSEPTGAAVSIDGSSGSDSSDVSDRSSTPRFDVQNVLTHELGHFFGLGEDYDDSHATMYISTRPGETNKRIVTTSDGTVMSALYAESNGGASADVTKAGCGGAKLARGNGQSSSAWIGFATASAGLILLAASRRDRRRPQVLLAPVRLRRRAHLARFGGWLTVASTFALLTPPDLKAAPVETTVQHDAEVQVTRAESRWVDGIVETDLGYRVTACHTANCPSDEQRVVVSGGKIGNLTQVVGPFAVPEVGARAMVRLRDGHGLLKKLGPTFRP